MGIGLRRTGLCVLVGLASLVASGCEPTPPWMKVPIAGFTPVSSRRVGSITGDQGSATVHELSGTTHQVFAGEQIAADLQAAGWNHVGDPDSASAYVVYPYQAADSADGKMFLVRTPHGQTFRYVHALEPGEAANNSFATISPDGRWLVSGEWGSQGRLLVFPMPMLNPAVGSGNRALPLAGEITLPAPLQDVQGCDFFTSRRLICASDDVEKHLWQVTLPAPLAGHDVTATDVTSLGTLPQVSDCTGGFESEGVDYDPASKLLRVQIIPPRPCYAFTDEYTYRKAS